MNPFKAIKQAVLRFLANEKLKRRLYIIIFESNTPRGKQFDVALLVVVLLSIGVLVVESMQSMPERLKSAFTILEYIFTFFFTLEYLARLYCAPSLRKYVLSFFGIIDLLSTLPFYLGWLLTSVRYLMVLRTFRLIRVFRVFKLFSFLNEGDLLLRSMFLSARKIMVFFLFVVVMVISLGTLMYMVEGGVEDTQFRDIPTSIYWAVVTMTTVGYGDIAPVTSMGRFLSMLVMLCGYTIMAVPTGIVSAQFIHDHNTADQQHAKCQHCGATLTSDARYCSQCGSEVES